MILGGKFSEITLDHFLNPRNVGTMPDADGTGSCGEAGCGDSLTVYIKVRNGIITEASFLVFGCVAAIASSSMTTVLAKGETLEQAAAITAEDIADALGGLPEIKLHCSVLGATALQNAISNYYSHQTADNGKESRG